MVIVAGEHYSSILKVSISVNKIDRFVYGLGNYLIVHLGIN